MDNQPTVTSKNHDELIVDLTTMDDSEFPREQVFDLLNSSRRRYVLYYLQQEGKTVTVSDLADQVAAWENNTSPVELMEEQRKRVYISLHQTHLPKLNDANVIDYNRETSEVHLTHRIRFSRPISVICPLPVKHGTDTILPFHSGVCCL